MKTIDFLKKHSACKDGAKWALSIGEEMVDIWNAMVEQGKYEWLMWTATRPGVFSDSVLRKLTCRVVRETPLHDGRTVWDLLTDERSRKAVEVAEAYTDGKATKEELDAACAAARDAYYTAAAYDAAYAAAYATADAAYDAADAVYAATAAVYAAARAAADAAYAHAKAAHIKMIAELGNPFRKERDVPMKIRLICCSSYQVGPDSWNLAYKTFDVPVPDSVVQSDEKSRNWMHNIVGAELIDGESEKERAGR